MSTLQEVRTLVIGGKAKEIGPKVQQALDEGNPPFTILNNALIDGMREIGYRFEQGDAFVPEMMIAARAMRQALEVLRPHLAKQGVKPIAKLVIGTVEGDMHDIGKSLVIMMCEGEGFEVVDLGIDVPPEDFVEAVRDGAQIIAMSALLTSTMMGMKTVIKAISQAGLRNRVKVIVGGAPVTQEFADEIGADGYAEDASGAARLARQLIDMA
jgi:5-methyltetrahydrofolate--homocysteine methyltransferase